jgi:hypothetical protein
MIAQLAIALAAGFIMSMGWTTLIKLYGKRVYLTLKDRQIIRIFDDSIRIVKMSQKGQLDHVVMREAFSILMDLSMVAPDYVKASEMIDKLSLTLPEQLRAGVLGNARQALKERFPDQCDVPSI